MEKNNINEEKKTDEDFNMYANPYADEDFKNNEDINLNENNNNNNEIGQSKNINDFTYCIHIVYGLCP